MRIIVGCECSGRVRAAFRKLGYDAWSCDILPAEDGSEYHIQGDLLEVLKDKWDMLIGHPPCTYLSLSGARWCKDHWVKNKKGDWWHDGTKNRENRDKAIEFFRKLWEADIPRICLENPMSVASTHVAPKSQTIQPYEYGHPEFKTTWLWLKNLPHLVPTEVLTPPVKGTPEFKEWSVVHYATPGDDRASDRSRTYQGIADAMADQWSKVL